MPCIASLVIAIIRGAALVAGIVHGRGAQPRAAIRHGRDGAVTDNDARGLRVRLDYGPAAKSCFSAEKS